MSIQESEIMAKSSTQEETLRKIQESEKKNEASEKKISDLEAQVLEL